MGSKWGEERENNNSHSALVFSHTIRVNCGAVNGPGDQIGLRLCG